MTRTGRFAVAAALAVACGTVFAAPSFAKECVLAGGKGTGLSKELAADFAKQALARSIWRWNGNGYGKIKVKVKEDRGLYVAIARQRACK